MQAWYHGKKLWRGIKFFFSGIYRGGDCGCGSFEWVLWNKLYWWFHFGISGSTRRWNKRDRNCQYTNYLMLVSVAVLKQCTPPFGKPSAREPWTISIKKPNVGKCGVNLWACGVRTNQVMALKPSGCSEKCLAIKESSFGAGQSCRLPRIRNFYVFGESR